MAAKGVSSTSSPGAGSLDLGLPWAKGTSAALGDHCFLGLPHSHEQLKKLILAAPEEVRGSLEQMERVRTIQMQWFRIVTYFVSGVVMLPYRAYVEGLWAPPFLLTALNLCALFVLRRVPWFRSLHSIIFLLDILMTEYMIWQYGAFLSTATLFLPLLIIALVFYLPPRTAVALSLLLIVLHIGQLFALRLELLPLGRIALNVGVDPSIVKNPRITEGAIVFSSFLLSGALIFSFRIFRLLRQREFELARTNEMIRRYVPAQLADQIFAGAYRDGEAAQERRKLTIFFSDIKDFVVTTEQLEPEELSRLLNEYLSEMAQIAQTYGGTLDKFIGDALMIFFGAPEFTDDKDHALRAVRMAVAMQQRMEELRRKWFDEGIQAPFKIRMGINTGTASVGNFGSEGRKDYTAIGTQVNLASRIQSFCEPGKILLSHSTWALVKDEIACRERGEVHVKGIHYPVKVYEVEWGKIGRPESAVATSGAPSPFASTGRW